MPHKLRRLGLSEFVPQRLSQSLLINRPSPIVYPFNRLAKNHPERKGGENSREHAGDDDSKHVLCYFVYHVLIVCDDGGNDDSEHVYPYDG